MGLEISSLRTLLIIFALITFIIFLFKRNKFLIKEIILFNFIILLSLFTGIYPNYLNIFSDFLLPYDFKMKRLIILQIASIIFLLIVTIMIILRLRVYKDKLDILVTKAVNIDPKLKKKRLNKIIILMPAYNECKNLEILIKKFPKKINGFKSSLIVIDDGSSDNTLELLKKNNINYISSHINNGQGNALNIGYDFVKKREENIDIIITMDADNQHNVEDLKKFIHPLISNKADIVIGSRALGSNKSKNIIRKIGIKLFNILFEIFYKKKLTDISSGFKAIKRSKLNLLNLKEAQFQSIDFLTEAFKANLKILEVPIVIKDRIDGNSKKGNDWSYGFNFFIMIINKWLNS